MEPGIAVSLLLGCIAGVVLMAGLVHVRRGERRVRAERSRVEALTLRSPAGTFETDAAGHMLQLNAKLGEMAGLAPGETGDEAIRDAIHPDDIDAVAAAWWRAIESGGDWDARYRYQRPDGTDCWALGHASPISDGNGGVSGWLGTVLDVTELQRGAAALRDAEERFRHAFEHALIGKALVSPEGAWLRVNPQVASMTGYAAEELVGMTVQDVTHPEDVGTDLAQLSELLAGEIDGYEVQKRYIRADGRVIWVLLSVSLVRGDDDEPLYFVSQLQDVTERRREETKLRHMADHDPLTGLVNRRRFGDDLEHELRRARRDAVDLSLLLLDVDGLKRINDSFGHRAGDELLLHVASALTDHSRERDIVGRLGGDEFAMVLPLTCRTTARQIAESVLASIRTGPLRVDGTEIQPSVSIGIVTSGDIEGGERTLLAGADRALYDAKASGRDRVAELEPDSRLAS